MTIEWQDVTLPDFGTPEEPPIIPFHIYDNRCTQAYIKAQCDWLVVYGDREHFANLKYLTGFDPRFEEALLLLGPEQKRILMVGNEGKGYACQAGIDLEIVLCQSFSLMGQDRKVSSPLSELLQEFGIHSGQKIGLVGWKYLESDEWTGESYGFFCPAFLVDNLRDIVQEQNALIDTTWILMHPILGLRATNEVEQIAVFEWAACRASKAVQNILNHTRPGISEYQAVSNMGYAGEPLSCHVMFATGKENIVGLRSPTCRRIEQGDGVTTAIGYWGGLCCRAGMIESENSIFLDKIAIPYFRGLAIWYESIHIGIEGEIILNIVKEELQKGGLKLNANPGHLTSYDEWVHTPIHEGSREKIISGMVFQSDIIPLPMPQGNAMNCEDPIVLGDINLRQEIQQKFPDLWNRISARQEFMRNVMGINIHDDVLPLSVIPAYLPPLWLSPNRVLIKN